jgi:peptidoglycan/xylan/chitin deacetylase (PgdA/CDA1 family)
VKHILKRGVQTALATLTRLRRHLAHRSLVILTYHRVLPANHPDIRIMQPGMVVDPNTFRKQLRWLKQFFHVVDLPTWVKTDKTLPANACAITFDDGWRDTFEFAYPILRDEHVPATLFLVSDMTGTSESFWPERLARLIWNNGRGFPDDVLREFGAILDSDIIHSLSCTIPDRDDLNKIIEAMKRYPDNVLIQRLAAVEQKISPGSQRNSHDILTWEQVEEMTRDGLVSIGSHGRSHFRLSGIPDKDTLQGEIFGSKEAIEARLGANVDVFCYPGGDVSALAEELVRYHYRAACTTDKGWNLSRTDRFRLKRISIHEDVGSDLTSFLARVSGWL